MATRTKFVSLDAHFKKSGFNPETAENKAAIAELMRRQAEYLLADLRRSAELTQTELASKLQVSQNRISQIELASLETMQIDTLRSYIEGLGGQLVIGAIIENEVVGIRS